MSRVETPAPTGARTAPVLDAAGFAACLGAWVITWIIYAGLNSALNSSNAPADLFTRSSTAADLVDVTSGAWIDQKLGGAVG